MALSLCSVVDEHDYHYHCSNIRRISGGLILNIIIRSVHVGRYSLYYDHHRYHVTINYAVFSGGGYYLYYTLRSFFGGYCLYYALRNIFGGSNTKGYWCILSKKYKQYTIRIPVFILYWEDPCKIEHNRE